MRQSTFIPSIEGMRAIAVLVVLAYHLDFSVVPGGFLGVDIFFVISGFVITRSIARQHQDGTFALAAFYLARIRRLIPALSVVILLTLIAAIFIIPPSDLEATGQSAVYAALSLSNFLFWSQADYFDAAAHTKPFLHTWSLAVEEQFYLIWPALLLLILSRRRVALAVPAALGIASLIAAIMFAGDHSSAVFFLAPFRAYQLMLGAVLGLLAWNAKGVAGNCSLAIGIAILLVAVCAISGEDSPVVGGLTAALAAGLAIIGRDSRVAQIALANRLAIWLGQRSYAIYLVHWPLIVLFKYRFGPELELSEQVALGSFSILLAEVLHRLIERPFRRSSGKTGGIPAGAALATTLILSLSGVFLAANTWGFRGFPGNQADEIDQLVAKVKLDHRIRRQLVRTGTCHAHSKFRLTSYDEDECAPLVPGKINVLVIGDSLAADLYLVLKDAYPTVAFSQATGGTCPPLRGIKRYTGCQQINEFRFDTLAARNYDYVVFSGYWRANHVDLLLKSIAHVENLGRPRVIVFGSVLEFKEDLVRLVSMSETMEEAHQNAWREADMKERLREQLRSSVGPDKYIDFIDLQCTPQCDIVQDKSLLYLDHIHLSPKGVETFAKRLSQAHPRLFQ